MQSGDLNTPQLIELLAGKYQSRLVILFGSFATGQAGDHSDVDVAVLLPTILDADEKLSLITELAAMLGREVDVVDLRVAGEPLLGEIITQGKRLYGSDEDYGNLIARHLIDTADFLPYRERILKERREAWLGA